MTYPHKSAAECFAAECGTCAPEPALRRPYEELHAELQVLRAAAEWEDEHGGCDCRTCIAALATTLTETDSP